MAENQTGTPRAWTRRGSLASGAFLFLIVVIGGALRLLTLKHESLWYDELYVVWARRLPLRDLWPEIYASEHPPVFNYIGHFWNYLGHNEFWVRSLSALIGTATIVLAYLAAKELFNRRVGIWSAAFVAAWPLTVWYSRDATSYAWVIAISLASFYLLVRSWRRGGRWNWSAYTVVTVIAVFSHLSSGVLVIAEAGFFLIVCRDPVRKIKPWLASQAVVLPAMVVMLVIGRGSGNGLRVADPLSLHTAGKLIRGIGRAAYTLTLGYINQPAGAPAALLRMGKVRGAVILLVVLALAAPLVSRRARKAFLTRRYVALTIFIMILAVGPIVVLLLRDADAAGRYYAWAAPPLAILLAALITAAPRRVATLAGVAIVFGLLVTTAYDLSIHHNENYGALMRVVEDGRQPGDTIFCFPQHNCIVAADFYFGEGIDIYGGFIDPSAAEGIYMGPEDGQWRGYRDGYRVDGSLRKLSGDALRQRVARDLAGHERFWLIAGDGQLGYLPAATIFEESLPGGWVVAETYEFPPLVLKLYVREPE